MINNAKIGNRKKWKDNKKRENIDSKYKILTSNIY